jgi:hypothetical protein
MTVSVTSRNCAHCGAEFTAQRVTRRYCSPACRPAALRQRRRELEGREPGNTRSDPSDAEPTSPYAAAEAPRVLDTSRDYGTLHGDTQGRAYEQDGHYFRADGREAGRG